MNHVHFIFAVHNHQPVGNFEHVLEKCFADCYQPFLDILTEYPAVRLALHYSGPLLQFIERKHPDYIGRLRALVDRNQVELMGGGFYEPILPAIPARDAIGQIKKQSDWLEKNLGRRPRGLWLAERVWEPHLPSLLAQTDLKYTMVDDTHLRAAGLPADQITGYYMTEDNGQPLAIFPVDRKLRYLIPFRLPEETIAYLRSMAEREPGVALTLGDDGEKFGVWPQTHKWVYEEGYLRRLFAALSENRDWIRMTTPLEYLQSAPPRGRIYLPTASYAEMMEWALPTPAREDFEIFYKEIEKWHDFDRFEPFVRGGMWRNFLVKYPESNFIHKKMLHLSERVAKAMKAASRKSKRANLSLVEEAQDEVWQAQCNCAYWHGMFGGLYLVFLRHALYEHLLVAESLLRQVDSNKPAVEQFDLDKDGHNEALLTTPDLTVGVAPAYGGSLFELSDLPARLNLANVLTRRREAYHRLISTAVLADKATYDSSQPLSIHSVQRVKELGLEQHVINDWYHRRLFQDHIFNPSVTLAAFARNQFHEMGDFVNQPYDVVECRQNLKEARLILRRDGGIYGHDGKAPLTITKTVGVSADSTVLVRYQLTSPQPNEIAVWFGSEINFTLLGADPDENYYDFGSAREGIAESFDKPTADSVSLVCAPIRFSCQLSFSPAARLWAFPVQTVSQSEGGMERTYQGSSLTPNWQLTVKPNAIAEVSVQLKFAKSRTGSS